VPAFAPTQPFTPTQPAAPAAPAPTLPFAAAPSTPGEAPFTVNDSGLLVVDVSLNDSPALHFELDSGATSVVFPQEMADWLMEKNLLTPADYLGQTKSTFADGSVASNNTYNLRSLTIGGVTIQNVRCTVVAKGGGYLLGQEVLHRFKSWSIDNERHVVVLHQITS
jgi:predicted aspartyl protease